MTKEQILDYAVETSPINRAVLTGMLDSFQEGDNKEEVELTATENKVYTPAEGKVYKKVTVNVPIVMPSAIDIDFNGGVGPESVTHLMVPILYGETFNAEDWWEENASLITPPTDKDFKCLATVPTNPDEGEIITTIDIASPTYDLYIIWQSVEPVNIDPIE